MSSRRPLPVAALLAALLLLVACGDAVTEPDAGSDDLLDAEDADDGEDDGDAAADDLDGDGSRVQIDVYVQETMGTPFGNVSWNGPEGIFGGPEDAVVDQAGDRITGSATLIDPMEGTESLAISFDLPVPSELTAYR